MTTNNFKAMGFLLGHIKPGTPRATVHPTLRDLEWAAGFLEGEGCFQFKPVGNTGTQRITCRQNNREPLEKLQALFGGTIIQVSQKSNKLASQPFINDWSVSGVLARGVMMTLYTFMSNVRKVQIKDALAEVSHWKSAPKQNKTKQSEVQYNAILLC